MLKVIEVVYEKGIFKPLEKVNLREGEMVKIKIELASVLSRKKGRWGWRITKCGAGWAGITT